MDKFGAFDYFIFTLLFALLLGAIFIIALIPYAIEQEQLFKSDCIAKGGVPSKYSTMVGKSSQSERLCIKKDTIIEMGGS